LEQVSLSLGTFPKIYTLVEILRIVLEEKLSGKLRLVYESKLESFRIKISCEGNVCGDILVGRGSVW